MLGPAANTRTVWAAAGTVKVTVAVAFCTGMPISVNSGPSSSAKRADSTWRAARLAASVL
jgi:hypothetical protein